MSSIQPTYLKSLNDMSISGLIKELNKELKAGAPVSAPAPQGQASVGVVALETRSANQAPQAKNSAASLKSNLQGQSSKTGNNFFFNELIKLEYDEEVQYLQNSLDGKFCAILTKKANESINITGKDTLNKKTIKIYILFNEQLISTLTYETFFNLYHKTVLAFSSDNKYLITGEVEEYSNIGDRLNSLNSSDKSKNKLRIWNLEECKSPQKCKFREIPLYIHIYSRLRLIFIDNKIIIGTAHGLYTYDYKPTRFFGIQPVTKKNIVTTPVTKASDSPSHGLIKSIITNLL